MSEHILPPKASSSMAGRITRALYFLFLSGFALSGWAQTITVTIHSPAASTKSGTPLSISVSITSTYEIDTVTATVADRSMNLTYAPDQSRWVGSLSLSGLPMGPQQLSVTAHDVFA